jgi:hypothetical protein
MVSLTKNVFVLVFLHQKQGRPTCFHPRQDKSECVLYGVGTGYIKELMVWSSGCRFLNVSKKLKTNHFEIHMHF